MNNLFKGSNSKFVMNLFKSLGVACAIVAVNSCNDKPENNNSNDNNDAAAKKKFNSLKTQLVNAGFTIENEEEIIKLIKAEKDTEDNDLLEKIKRSDFVKEKTPAASDVDNKPKEKGDASVIVDKKITECEHKIDAVSALLNDKKIDFKKDENKKALFKILGDCEIVLDENCKILDLAINDQENLKKGLDFIDKLRNCGIYNKIEIVVNNSSCLSVIYKDGNSRYDFSEKKIRFNRLASKIKIENGSKSFNIKIGNDEINLDSFNKLNNVIICLSSVNGLGDFFDGKMALIYNNSDKGMFSFNGEKIKLSEYGEGSSLMEQIHFIQVCRKSGLFEKVLEGVKLSTDANDTEVVGNSAVTYIMGVEIKTALKLKKSNKKDAVKVIETLVSGVKVEEGNNDNYIVAHVEDSKNNNIDLVD